MSDGADLIEESLRALEFPALLDVASGYAATAPGARAIRALRPVFERTAALREYAPVGEIMTLLSAAERMPVGAIPEAGEIIARLERLDSLVEAREWAEVRALLEVSARTAEFFTWRSGACPACAREAAPLKPLEHLARAIDRVIDADGIVRDSASPDLGAIRRDLRRARGRVQQQMEAAQRNLAKTGALQGDYWTLRRGRNTLPVKATHKGRAPGIVHDTSDSGETLFIEPFAVVEAANAVTDLEGREAEEIRRVLIELGSAARPSAPDLRENMAALVRLDSLYGRANYGYRNRFCIPKFSRDSGFHIREARHPLLLAAAMGKDAQAGSLAPPADSTPSAVKAVAPIELDFRGPQRALTLTGPNTGGKTTTLKTLGLLCAMAHAGIPVPAAGDSEFPALSGVFADIGDEQSLAAGLSSFSGQLLSIKRVLEQARAGALVLLDELGRATDPIQGAALSAAILERLVECGATVLATTHLPELKRWAHEHPAARNAATRFDEIEGRPTYQILYDQPGASEALRIARSLGFPGEIIDAAERRVPAGERALESILISLEEKERRLAETLAALDREREELADRRAEFDQQYERFREEERRRRKGEVEERERVIAAARADVERRIAHLGGREDLSQAREELRAEERRMEAEARKLEDAAPEALDFEELREGMDVYLPAVRGSGRIVRLLPKGKRAVVQARGAEIEVKAHQLSRLPAGFEPETPIAPPQRRGGIRRGNVAPVRSELNLHGERVEAALEKVERYLDHALADGLESVDLLVGRGALRDAIEQHLRRHPHIHSLTRGEPEGGRDATLTVRFGAKRESQL